MLSPSVVFAETVYYHNGFAAGVGYNLASENNATEDMAFSLKFRQRHWQYGIDHCMSGNVGGKGDTEYQFLWASYIEEFSRPESQEYGLYAGIGGGGFLGMDEGFLETQYGPFAVVGWDATSYLGLEGKIGLFGRNNWATGFMYFYF
jgi:hypothetical protein